jgi:hypothetical protein
MSRTCEREACKDAAMREVTKVHPITINDGPPVGKLRKATPAERTNLARMLDEKHWQTVRETMPPYFWNRISVDGKPSRCEWCNEVT